MSGITIQNLFANSLGANELNWISSEPSKNRDQLVSNYFQTLMGKSSPSTPIERWVYDFFVAVQSSASEKEIISRLNFGNQSEGLKKWMCRIVGRKSDESSLTVQDINPDLLENLISKIGLENAFSLLNRSYQMTCHTVHKTMSSSEGDKSATMMGNLLQRMSARHPEQCAILCNCELTFDQAKVPQHFLQYLEQDASHAIRRQKIIKGIVATILGISGALLMTNHINNSLIKFAERQKFVKVDTATGEPVNFPGNSPFIQSRDQESLNAPSSSKFQTILEKLTCYQQKWDVTDGQFKGLDFAKVTKEQFNCLISNDPAKRIGYLSPKQLSLVLDKLTCYQQKWDVTDGQFKGLDFAKVTKEQFNCLTGNDLSGYIGKLSPEQLSLVLDKLTCYQQKRFVSDDQFKGLDFAKVTKEQFDCLIADNPSEHIGKLTPKQLSLVLDKLTCSQQKWFVSDDQFKGLDFAKVTKEQFDCLIADNPSEHIGKLTPKQLNLVLDKLTCFQQKWFVSDDQYKGLDFAKVTKEQFDCLIADNPSEHIGKLTPKQLSLVLDKLTCFQQKWFVSDDQYKGLDFAKVTKEQFDCLIADNPSEHIGKLTPKQLSLVLDKLTCFQQKWFVSDDQYKGLDFAKVTKEQFDCLIADNPSEHIGQLTPKQLSLILDKLTCSQQKWFVSDDQFKGLDFAKVTKGQFDCLTNGKPERISLLDS